MMTQNLSANTTLIRYQQHLHSNLCRYQFAKIFGNFHATTLTIMSCITWLVTGWDELDKDHCRDKTLTANLLPLNKKPV